MALRGARDQRHQEVVAAQPEARQQDHRSPPEVVRERADHRHEQELHEAPRRHEDPEGARDLLPGGEGAVSLADEDGAGSVGDRVAGRVAAGEGAVWVRGDATLLVVIDPKTNRVSKRYGPPQGSGAVRAGDGKVWVSAHDTNKLWSLDPKR